MVPSTETPARLNSARVNGEKELKQKHEGGKKKLPSGFEEATRSVLQRDRLSALIAVTYGHPNIILNDTRGGILPDSGRNGQTRWEEPRRRRAENNAAVVVSLFLW